MKNQDAALCALGWSDWFEQQELCKLSSPVARVVAINREQYVLMDQTGLFHAKLSGSFMHHHRLSHEYPCVGDWVGVRRQPKDDLGLIHALFERRTSLRRKTAGNNIEHQMIAANIDYAVIVQSCQGDFNLKRLERYLVMVSEGGAEPYILLTKTDLADPTVLAAQLADIAVAGITAPVYPLSNVTGSGLEAFRRSLLPRKTYCFVGSSGVGKSTLINQLIGRQKLAIGELSETGEGRHTTVCRELLVLEEGALVIDNPGMREVGILGAESGIQNSFADIVALAPHCRYRNCSHNDEPGCAVLAAIEAGTISPESFENFHKLREETSFNDLSYAEKRKKDRSFGRFIKSAKKDLKKG